MLSSTSFALILGVLSLVLTIYFARHGERAFNRFFMVWLMLAVAGTVISEMVSRHR